MLAIDSKFDKGNVCWYFFIVQKKNPSEKKNPFTFCFYLAHPLVAARPKTKQSRYIYSWQASFKRFYLLEVASWWQIYILSTVENT